MTDSVDAVTSRTFAIGDLHGEITLPRQLLRQLLAHIQPTAGDILIFLGDYVDRGEDSVATCEELSRLQGQGASATGPRIIALRGNHDDAWLEVWTGNGYRKRPAIPGARAIGKQYRGLPPASIGRFLETTKLTYEDEHGFSCHAGIAPGLAPQEAGSEVWHWGAGDFLTSTLRYPKSIVFGHYEVDEPLITPQRICLDTAGYRTGALTAMWMETRKVIQVRRMECTVRMIN